MSAPIRYTRGLEQPKDDEADTQRALDETLRAIQEQTATDYGHAVRSVHAKGHGLLRGSFEVLGDLPPELAQGLFAQPGRYEAILRLSTNPGDILDDSVSAPRGAALKIVGGAGDGRPQDFVMADGPAFAAPDAEHFLTNLKLLAKTTDRGEGAKKALSAVLRAVEKAVETVSGPSPTLQSLGGAPNSHPLGRTYYSQTAFRFGDHAAKFSLAPVSPMIAGLADDAVSVTGRPDALREVVAETMIAADAVWEFRVQLCTDAEAMPIEDASVVWDEMASPYRTVARLTVPAQAAWTPGESEAAEDSLSFSPWHCREAHQPLGSINRARRGAYEHSAAFRAERNGCPIHEPQPESLAGA